MRIFVLGASGMLGRVVARELKNSIPLSRGMLLPEVEPTDVVVNCIGAIPQKNPSLRDYIQANTIIPYSLSSLPCKVIHISTDCVFDGSKGNYIETDPHTATEAYGITKSMGEVPILCIIRTSIIGEGGGLLEWVRQSKGTIQGYSNHYWNGMTCTTLARYIQHIIETGQYWQGVRHVYSPSPVNKYELCCMIRDAYNVPVDIVLVEHSHPINRTLQSIYPCDFPIQTILEQIHNDLG